MKRPRISIWLPVLAIEKLKESGKISQELAGIVGDFYWESLPPVVDNRIYIPVEKRQVTFHPDEKQMAKFRNYCALNGKSLTQAITQALVVLDKYKFPS
jgi:hypothetical protein